MNLIDFDFDGGGRTEAFSALQRFYPNYSVKRRVLKLMNSINQLSVRLPAHNSSQIAQIKNKLPQLPPKGTRAYLLHKIDQNDRAYIFDQDQDGQCIAVTKVAFNAVAAEGLKREAETLRSLYGRTEFAIPELKAYEAWGEGFLVQVSAVSSAQTIHDKRVLLPDAIFAAVAKLRDPKAPKYLSACQIEGWQEARCRIRTAAIEQVAEKIGSEDVFEVSAAHRDLGSENIFSLPNARAVADFTLIDWEFFTETAPAMTDRVSVWLGSRHRAFKSRNGPGQNALAEAFLAEFENTQGGKAAAVLALLHLADLGIDLACFLTGERQ